MTPGIMNKGCANSHVIPTELAYCSICYLNWERVMDNDNEVKELDKETLKEAAADLTATIDKIYHEQNKKFGNTNTDGSSHTPTP